VARVRKELEAELYTAMTEDGKRLDASILPLFSQPGPDTRRARAGESDVDALHRMVLELESRLIDAEQRTLERIEGLERHLEQVESRLSETGDDAVVRARALERNMVKLAERIRELEPPLSGQLPQ
jgi:hypothetical protein